MATEFGVVVMDMFFIDYSVMVLVLSGLTLFLISFLLPSKCSATQVVGDEANADADAADLPLHVGSR